MLQQLYELVRDVGPFADIYIWKFIYTHWS